MAIPLRELLGNNCTEVQSDGNKKFYMKNVDNFIKYYHLTAKELKI